MPSFGCIHGVNRGKIVQKSWAENIPFCPPCWNYKPLLISGKFITSTQYVASIIVARFVLLPAKVFVPLEKNICHFRAQNVGNSTCFLALCLFLCTTEDLSSSLEIDGTEIFVERRKMMTGNNATSSRGDADAIRLQVTKNVRALLISAPNGLTVAEIQRDYNNMIGKPLPFREMGYNTPLDLLKDLPNVTRPTWENGVLVLRGKVGLC